MFIRFAEHWICFYVVWMSWCALEVGCGGLLPQYTTQVKPEGRTRPPEQTKTNSTFGSRGAAFIGQPWHSAPLKDADFVHALQRASMSTSLFLPCGLRQGVRWIYKEAHANRTAPLPDSERWSDGGRVCLYLKVGSHERGGKKITHKLSLLGRFVFRMLRLSPIFSRRLVSYWSRRKLFSLNF